MKQPKRLFIPVFIIFLISLVLYQFSCSDKNAPVFGGSEQSPLKGSTDAARAWEIQKNFRAIYDLYKDRVVFISTEQTVNLPQHPFFNDPFFREFFGVPGNQGRRVQKRTGLGTGFVLSEDGYICTNHHVVAGVDKVTVKINDATYPAKVIGSDEKTDIALLKITTGNKLKPVFIGNSDTVKVGDWSIAIGNRSGSINIYRRRYKRDGKKGCRHEAVSQSHIHRRPINPGNSGGPLSSSTARLSASTG